MPSLSFTLACPIPANLDPERVVEALHLYEPLITPNPFLISFRRRPVELTEIVDDPFFREDGQALAAFEVVDRIVLVPGLATKQVVIPCVMQRFDGGLRCRSFAAGGVRVWSTWRVMPVGTATAANNTRHRKPTTAQRQSTKTPTPPITPPPPAGHDYGTPAYELVEEARVTCGALVKPFVGRSFQSAHVEILRKVIRGIVQEQKEQA